MDGLATFNTDGERTEFQFHLLLNKGIYLEKMKQPEKGLEAIEELHAAIDALPSTNIVLSTVHLDIIIEMYNMYAVILNQLHLHEKALDFAQQGLIIAQKNKYFDRLLTLRTTLGIIYADLDDIQKAEKCFLMALDLKKRTKREYLLVFAYSQLSLLYLNQENWEKAEQILEEAISICERNHDLIHLIECLVALGDCSVQQGRYDKAIPLYQKAEELLKTSKNSQKKCEIAINLGYCYKKIGNDKAFETYKNKVFQVNTELKWGGTA